AVRGVEEVQDAVAVLVRDERDALAVPREAELGDVPGDVRREDRLLARREVDVGEALELGALVGRDVDALAVRGEGPALRRDLLSRGALREPRPLSGL